MMVLPERDDMMVKVREKTTEDTKGNNSMALTKQE